MMFFRLSLIFALMLPVATAYAQPLFEYDNQATADLQEPLRDTLVADGQRVVGVNVTALLESGDLMLPDGRQYRLEPMEIRETGSGRFAWHGRILDQRDAFRGSATFTVQGDRVAGRFAVGARQFQLISLSPSRQVLLEHDPSLRAPDDPEGGPLRVTSEMLETAQVEPASAVSDESKAASSHAVIDVVIFYTQGAIDSASGDELGLRLEIVNAVDATNTAYINSDVSQRVRLVSLHPTAFSENSSDMEADLKAYDDDPTMNGIREERAADLSALIGGYGSAGNCGIAWLKTDLGQSWRTSGYSVTRRSCLSGDTLAHELGHNMGLAHDPGNSDSEGIRPYAYGYQVDGDFHTIMAYSSGCTNCVQIEHFSNPDVDTADGVPTGDADQDNARALAYSDDDVADYYSPLLTLGAAMSGSSYDAAVLDWTTGGNAIWRAQDDVTRNGQAVPASGPIHADESTWIEVELPGPGDVAFDWRREAGAVDPPLELLVDGQVKATYTSAQSGWQTEQLEVTGNSPVLRWRLEAPAGAGFNNIGEAYLAEFAFGQGDVLTGTVLNSKDVGVEGVDVSITADGAEHSAKTADDGTFGLNLPAGALAGDETLTFSGTGMTTVQRPASECEGVGGVCEQMVSGASRSISGTVTNMIAGEDIPVALTYLDGNDEPVVDQVAQITADANGVVAFDLNAEATVRYASVSVTVDGYSGGLEYAPDGGIDVRSGDLDGISLNPTAKRPRISNSGSGDVTETAFTAEAEIETSGREAEVDVVYGEDVPTTRVGTTLQTADGDFTPVSVDVSGLDCGTSYDWYFEVTNDTGASRTGPTNTATTADCSGGGGGGSGGGCVISDGQRLDPTFLLVLALSMAGLLVRRVPARRIR